MSTPHFPLLKPGTMVMFPSTAVHMVTPYVGTQTPRITLTWNINAEPLPNRPQRDRNSSLIPTG
jgi:hypothetical protein